MTSYHLLTLSEAKQRASNYNVSKLFTESQAKIDKSNQSGNGYLSIILHLAPADMSGYNVCPKASEGCKAACLNTAGRGRFHPVQQARLNKTLLFFEDRSAFMTLLWNEIYNANKRAMKSHLGLAVRLNGTSDISWERIAPELFEDFEDVQFYDYTKIASRMLKPLPTNYHLTFSRSEVNDNEVQKVLKAKGNVAVVFPKNELPSKYLGIRVFDGDETDLRFLDPAKRIIGLSAKGKAKKDETGFVVYNTK